MNCVTFSTCASRRLFKSSPPSYGNKAHLTSSAPVLNDSTAILLELCGSLNLWLPIVVWLKSLFADQCRTWLRCRQFHAIESAFVESEWSHSQGTWCVWVFDDLSPVRQHQLAVRASRTSKRNKTGQLASEPRCLISRVCRQTQLVSPSWSYLRRVSWPIGRAFFLVPRVWVWRF
jgi:hypothetical protein